MNAFRGITITGHARFRVERYYETESPGVTWWRHVIRLDDGRMFTRVHGDTRPPLELEDWKDFFDGEDERHLLANFQELTTTTGAMSQA